LITNRANEGVAASKMVDCRSNSSEGAVKKSAKKIAVASLLIVFLCVFKLYAATPKKAAPQVWTPGCVASVPKSWGQFRGGSAQSGLAFEDQQGTLRFLTNIPCDGTPLVALEIRRTTPPTN
jgi:hypothetical protein